MPVSVFALYLAVFVHLWVGKLLVHFWLAGSGGMVRHGGSRLLHELRMIKFTACWGVEDRDCFCVGTDIPTIISEVRRACPPNLSPPRNFNICLPFKHDQLSPPPANHAWVYCFRVSACWISCRGACWWLACWWYRSMYNSIPCKRYRHKLEEIQTFQNDTHDPTPRRLKLIGIDPEAGLIQNAVSRQDSYDYDPTPHRLKLYLDCTRWYIITPYGANYLTKIFAFNWFFF